MTPVYETRNNMNTTFASRRSVAICAGAAALVLGLAGCATSAPGTATTSSANGAAPAANGEVTTIKLSNPANISNIPLYLGIEQGFFEEEGIKVEPGIDLGAGSTVEAVIGGQVDMAWVNTGGALAPVSQGIDLKLVSITDQGTPGNLQVIVKPDSPLQNLADLQGQTLAVLSPSTNCVWLVKSAMAEQGLDPNSVEMTVVSPPEHAIVLDSGQVDATCTTDPTKAAMVQKLNVRSIFDPAAEGVESQREFLNGGYVVSGAFAGANKEALEAFQRALAKSAAYANSHEEDVRRLLTEVANVDPEVASKVTIPHYAEETGASEFADGLETTVDAMKETGITDKDIDLTGFIFE